MLRPASHPIAIRGDCIVGTDERAQCLVAAFLSKSGPKPLYFRIISNQQSECDLVAVIETGKVIRCKGMIVINGSQENGFAQCTSLVPQPHTSQERFDVLLDLQADVTCASSFGNDEILVTGVIVAPTRLFVSREGLVTNAGPIESSLGTVPNARVAAARNDSVILGCDNGQIIDGYNGRIVADRIPSEDHLSTIWTLENGTLVLTKGGRLFWKSLNNDEWIRFGSGTLLESLKLVGAIVMNNGKTVVTWSHSGSAYITYLNDIHSVLRVPISGGRVIQGIKVNETIIVFELSNSTCVAYKISEAVINRAGEMDNLVYQLTQFEGQEQAIEQKWVGVDDSLRKVAFAIAMRESSGSAHLIRFIKRSSDWIRFEFTPQWPSMPKEQRPTSALSLVVHFEYGKKRRATVSKSVFFGNTSIEFELPMTRSDERYLPVAVTAMISVSFQSGVGYSQTLVRKQVFDILDTAILEDELSLTSDDYSLHPPKRHRGLASSILALRVFGLKRDAFVQQEQLFGTHQPAQHLMQLLLPASWTFVGTNLFKCIASAGHVRVQLEIDGNVVEMKVMTPETIVAACLRTAIWRRLNGLLVPNESRRAFPSRLVIGRALVEAEAALEDASPMDGDGVTFEKNDQMRQALEQSVHAWVVARTTE